MISGAKESSPSLSIEKLSHRFDQDLVLDNVTCSFPTAALVGVLGPSGCGKTTLLRCAAGLLRTDTGQITLNGISPAVARKRGEVGFAFQAPTLLPWRTALQNVMLPLEILRRSNGSAERERAGELLHLVDLGDHSAKLPHELSGGMQQRVSLARALVTTPDFLFLDEPFGALDGITRDRLNEKVRELWETRPITIVFVTHSIEEAVFLSDYIVILSRLPARVRYVLPIDLGSGRNINTRTTEKFFQLTSQVRRLVEEEI